MRWKATYSESESPPLRSSGDIPTGLSPSPSLRPVSRCLTAPQPSSSMVEKILASSGVQSRCRKPKSSSEVSWDDSWEAEKEEEELDCVEDAEEQPRKLNEANAPMEESSNSVEGVAGSGKQAVEGSGDTGAPVGSMPEPVSSPDPPSPLAS